VVLLSCILIKIITNEGGVMLYLDTLKTVNELTNSGMDEKQARTISTMLKDLMDS
jgi:hypothetical protein